MLKLFPGFAALVALSLIGNLSSSFASEVSAEAPVYSSSSTLETVLDAAKKNVRSSYFGILSGTNLDFDGYHPNPDASDSGLLGVWSVLGLGYKATPGLQLDAQVVFDWVIAGGHQFVMQPPRLGVSGQVLATDSWSLWSNLNAELPVTDTARAKTLITSVGSFQELWFNPTRTGRLQLGAFHWVRVYAYNDAAGRDRVSGAITPLVRYRLAEGLDAQLGYVFNYQLKADSALSSLGTGITQIQPGINWVISSRFAVMPYLIIQPQGEMSAASTSFGAWVSGTIL